MRLYLIRHADPDYPNNTITAAGHLEAQALARRLTKQGLDLIYSSPFGRAVDTMRYTADALGIEPEILEWTAELTTFKIDEQWGAKYAWDLPGEIIRGCDPLPSHDTWHLTTPLDDPHFQEKFSALKQHSDDFLAQHGYERQGGRYRCLAPNRKKIAVFCHNGFGLTWLAHLLEIPVSLIWSGFWLAPSSVTTILLDERSPEWAVPRCLAVGDVSHLYAEGLPVQQRGLLANCE
jgi:broad specificity phosphatase PhoE